MAITLNEPPTAKKLLYRRFSILNKLYKESAEALGHTFNLYIDMIHKNDLASYRDGVDHASHEDFTDDVVSKDAGAGKWTENWETYGSSGFTKWQDEGGQDYKKFSSAQDLMREVIRSGASFGKPSRKSTIQTVVPDATAYYDRGADVNQTALKLSNTLFRF